MPWSRIIPLEQCRRDGGTFVQRAGLNLAVFLLSDPDRVFVIDDTCPHAGGSLACGDVQGQHVTCPYHQWTFDVATGAGVRPPTAQVRSYPAEIREGAVWADLPAES